MQQTEQPYRVRSEEFPQFTGFINVTIMDMSLVKLHYKNMLMCTEWLVNSQLVIKSFTDTFLVVGCPSIQTPSLPFAKTARNLFSCT